MLDPTQWLANTAPDLTPEEHEAFIAVAEEYFRQPHHGDRAPEDWFAHQEEDQEVMSVILQHILGEATIEDASRDLDRAWETLNRWMRVAAADGMHELDIARRANRCRSTVRRHLGKIKPRDRTKAV